MAQAQIYRKVMQRILRGLFANPTFRSKLFLPGISPGSICEGFLRDTSLKRGSNVAPLPGFFAKLFFTWNFSRVNL
jgi:hypothetical protein